jgi:hypothetical protein
MPAETQGGRGIADGTAKACSCAGVGGPADYIFMHVSNNKDSGPDIKQLLQLSGAVAEPKPSDDEAGRARTLDVIRSEAGGALFSNSQLGRKVLKPDEV